MKALDFLHRAPIAFHAVAAGRRLTIRPEFPAAGPKLRSRMSQLGEDGNSRRRP
jgi:hypothetical protein